MVERAFNYHRRMYMWEIWWLWMLSIVLHPYVLCFPSYSEVKFSKYYFELFVSLFLCLNRTSVRTLKIVSFTDFKRGVLFPFTYPPIFFFFLLVSVFSLTFIKLSLSSEGWENFAFKKESLPTSQIYIFPQALNSLIFFPFKMRKSLARNWLDVRTGASGSSNLSDSFNKPILLSGLLHIEQDLPSGPPGRKVSL